MAKNRFAVFSLLAAALLAGPLCKLTAAQCVDPNVPAPCPRVGPQSPRDISNKAGTNPVKFSKAPQIGDLKLCDIHFHKYAEHKIPGTVAAAPPGGFVCRPMPRAEKSDEAGAGAKAVCESADLWDTVEVHWVFTSCNVDPAPCLTSCFSPSCANPNLRVAAQVFVLTPDDYPRAINWAAAGYDTRPPSPAGNVEYLGSTTGSDFNRPLPNACSPYQATWSVGRECRPLTMSSLGRWCENNPYNERKPHGVRNLVTDLGLLERIP